MHRALAIFAAALLVTGSAPAFAEEASGKVIEFDGSGNAKGEAEGLKQGEISQADSCRLRLAAQCQVLQRCGVSQEAFPCQALVAKCSEVSGKAPYGRKVAEACAKAIGRMPCQNSVDVTNPASLDPAAKLPACRPIIEAEKKQAKQSEKQKKKGDFAPSDFSPSEFKASDFSPSDFSPSDFSGGF